MSKTNEHHAEVKDEPGDRFSSDFETLKASFTQLRDDVSRILDNSGSTGRSGAGMIKNRGTESIQDFGQKIAERPVLSAAIAVGIGFVLAKVFTSRR